MEVGSGCTSASGFGAEKPAFAGSQANSCCYSLGLTGVLGGWKDTPPPRRILCAGATYLPCPSCQVCVAASMKLKKQVTVCGAAIFCVAVFSLYLMLDRVQHDPARHQGGGNFPRVSHARPHGSSLPTPGVGGQVSTPA